MIEQKCLIECIRHFFYLPLSYLCLSARVKHTIKYTLIKKKDQYSEYSDQLERLLSEDHTEQVQDEIDLLTLLIEKYDEDNNNFQETDPITMLRSFMEDHHMKPQDLTTILGISKGYVSDILNYRKGL